MVRDPSFSQVRHSDRSAIATMLALYCEEGEMSEFSTIVYAVTDQVARITLNRVAVRNAQETLLSLNQCHVLYFSGGLGEGD